MEACAAAGDRQGAGDVRRQRAQAAKQSTRGHRSGAPPEAQRLRLLHAGRCVMSPEPLSTLPACCKTFLLHAGQVGTSAGKLPTCPAWSAARLFRTRKVGRRLSPAATPCSNAPASRTPRPRELSRRSSGQNLKAPHQPLPCLCEDADALWRHSLPLRSSTKNSDFPCTLTHAR